MKAYTNYFAFILFVYLLSSCNSAEVEVEVSLEKPNVIFILADDLGYYDLSCNGSKYYETPNIDRIANEGMVFTNGYANCQVCSPSRASIMSGKFPARHGITDYIGAVSGITWRDVGRFNRLIPADYIHRLPSEYIVLPEAMKESGYKTFFAGKWHLGDEGSWPTDHGFDINIGGWDSGSPIGGYFSPWENPMLENKKDGEDLSLRLADETIDFIKANKDTTFFAFLSFYAVHSPIETTKEKWQKYRDKAEEQGIAESAFKMGKFLPIRQTQDNPIYGGLVETMDDAVGRVLETLDQLDLAKNTIIIFTSDNGGVASGDAFSTSNLPLKGGKGHAYEGGIREPYFIKVPGAKNAGQQNNTPVTGADFYPTILELVGGKSYPFEHQDGLSLVPLLKGKTIEERPLIWHYPHYGNQGGEPTSIIREGDWKLIHFYEDDREELYNLANDPSESQNLAPQYPDLTGEMNIRLFQYLVQVGALLPSRDRTYKSMLANQYREKMVKEKLPMLEKQRMEFLSKDFNPGNHWWGSSMTND